MPREAHRRCVNRDEYDGDITKLDAQIDATLALNVQDGIAAQTVTAAGEGQCLETCRILINLCECKACWNRWERLRHLMRTTWDQS